MSNQLITIITFFSICLLVAFLTWMITRKENSNTNDGFFLAGRSLTFPFIAGSLLLTNLSTEQLIGLNGSAFKNGLCVMAWEVVAVIAIVLMALYFLPKYLKHGITTVPDFINLKIGHRTSTSVSIILLLAYIFMLLPIILYTGATGLVRIADIPSITGISNPTVNLVIIDVSLGVIGMIYAIFGGLRCVAVSDTFNGIALFVGGFLLTFFALDYVSDGQGFMDGIRILYSSIPEKFSSIGGENSEVPFCQVFTGIFLINLFYWCTNQQIIQRTFAAKNLKEGQKGVLLCGLLKLLGPLYLVLPGIIAYYIFTIKLHQDIRSDDAYGLLVHKVLPPALTGLMLASVFSAIISSFDSVLNSSSTLFSICFYKKFFNKEATDIQVIKAGKIFGYFVGICSIIVAPFLANTGSIFNFLQNANASYFTPVLALVLSAMIFKKQSDKASPWIFWIGALLLFCINYIPAIHDLISKVYYHISFLIFILMLICFKIAGIYCKDAKEISSECGANFVDLTPWKHTRLVSGILILIVIALYIAFARG